MSSSPELAHQVVEALADEVDHVVICPGSRNSPLVLALLARRDIRVHMRIDERSAAFLALGIARVARRGVAVVMTSGTAVANCLPAVIEAHHAHVPLVVLSADRPRRLVGTGANQTIDQDGIFGVFAATTEVTDASDVAGLFPSDGPVHLNVAFADPLVAEELPEVVGTVRPPRPAHRHSVDHGEVDLDVSRPTIVIAGDEAWEVEGLEEVPTIAEPSAPAPFHPVHPLAAPLIAHEGAGLEQVVVVGHPTLHREVMALLKRPGVTLTVLSQTEQITNPDSNADAVGTRVKVAGVPSAQWSEVCEAASQMAAAAVRDVLDDEDYGFTGLHVAAALADELGDGDSFFVAASNPVRDMSLVGLPFAGVETYSPRGVAGIDGSVSQATGVALASQARDPEAPRSPRTFALLGDLAFLHDVGGLLIGPTEVHPENFTLVVANDEGGGIFESLEVGDAALRENFERGFGTPHQVDIADLCAGFGVEYQRVESLMELQDALVQPHVGMRVVEASVTRSTRREIAAHLTEAVKVP